MGKNVYANGNAIAAKVGGGKVIAAFPDVCMSPPPPPAGPIPIPYPNSSFSKDLKKGSKTVKIGGKPLAITGSFYKTSPLGNEAATKNFGASVLSHQTSGNTEFVAYSFDVKVEGKNVCRHMDLATSNHGSLPGSTLPMPNGENVNPATLADKKDAQWGHLVAAHCVDGNHDWQCGVVECPRCWDPVCIPNAEETNQNYAATQSGTRQERTQRANATNRDIADTRPAEQKGAQAEIDAVNSIGADSIVAVGYKAHCGKCHLLADFDIVTGDTDDPLAPGIIYEVKAGKKLNHEQISERTIPAGKKCFPNKQVKFMVRKEHENKIARTLGEKEYRGLGLAADFF